MAAGNFTMFYAAKRKLLVGKKIDMSADALKLALCTNVQTINAGFLGASGDCRYADLTAEVANGNGYTTGGAALSTLTDNWYVASATVAAGGSGGTNGTQTVTGTTGAGTLFQASVTVSGNAITAVLSIVTAGAYTTLPTNALAEPVTGASLAGAQLNLNMGVVFTSAAVSWASATFVTKYAVLYDNTATNKDLVGYTDWETTVSQGTSVTNGTLTWTPNAAGIFTLL